MNSQICNCIFFTVPYNIKKYNTTNKKKKFIFNTRWDVIKWYPKMKYKNFRQQRMIILNQNNLHLWKDKIWLIKWYKENKINGPPYIYFSRKESDISPYIENRSDYCIKPSHLSEKIGVFIIRNNKLIKDVDYYRIINVPVPSYFHKFKVGYKITTIEINNAMQFLKTVVATWESNIFKNVQPGIVIENLHNGNEIKVFVMLGYVIGFYYIKGCGFDLNQVFNLAEATAITAGIDFVRIDIIFYKGKYRVSEFTFNPRISYWNYSTYLVNQNFHKLVDFHMKRKNHLNMQI